MSQMTQSYFRCMQFIHRYPTFGLRAIEYFVPNYRQSINPRFTTQFILEAASFILSNNSMTFDEMFYLQIQGTAMGTILPRHTLHYQRASMK